MTTQNADLLQDIFRTVFDLHEGADVTSLEQSNTPAWDSLAHVALVTAIESEFGLSLEAPDQLQMTSYASTLLVLAERWQ